MKGNPIGAKDPTGHLGQLIPVAVRVGQGLAAAGMALCSSGKINCGDIVPNKADKPRDTSISPNDAKQIEKSGLDPLNAKKGSQKSIGEDSKNGSNDGGKSGVSNKGNNTGNGSGKSDIGSTRSSNKLAPYKDSPNDKKAQELGSYTNKIKMEIFTNMKPMGKRKQVTLILKNALMVDSRMAQLENLIQIK
ncbi:hypothetical protein LEP1GSC168_0882 [Leptospira santarosai str. HAI134]|nr:hypothetical protein LEP1GSC168_0882 [Leptospira santarosai str. HAI134]